MRLIDAIALKKAFKRSPSVNEVHLYYARQLIDNAPTVEAYTYEQVKELVNLNKKLSEERPHGEWKPYNRTGIRFQCSVCNGRYTNAYHFCPHCGASMKGDD